MKVGSVIAGVALGIAFVLACEGRGDRRAGRGSGGVSTAHASPPGAPGCAQWQVARVSNAAFANATDAPGEVPPGWEPLSMPGAQVLVVRRCKP